MPETGGAPSLDVVTIGRSSVDLYGKQIGSRLEDISSFAKSVGGCPANIAIGAARLGLKAAIVTGVGAEQMGRFLLRAVRPRGRVDRPASKSTRRGSPPSCSSRSRTTRRSR